VVTLSGTNTYTGTTTISNGTISVTNFAAIGANNAAVNITPGGALDLVGFPTANVANGFGTNKVFTIAGTGVSGTGAITNSGTLSQQNAFQKINLSANATIGGTGRFDLRGTDATLDLGGNTLTKIGTNQFSVVSGTIHAGNIIVNDGFFQIESASTVNESGLITVNSPGTLRFHQLGNGGGDGMSMPIALNGGAISDNNQTHVSTVASPISLAGANTFNIQNSTGFTFSGDITGAGGMTKTGNGLMVLNGANNNSTGALAASGGKLQLDSNQIGSSSTTASGTGLIELSESAGFNRVLKTGVVSTSETGKIDLKNNKLLSSGPVGTSTGGVYNGLQGEVQKAYDFGSWDLPGLMTSMPAAGPLVGTNTIGVSDGASVLFLGPTETGTFAGQTVTGATAIAVYTYAGDVNFDGLVDASDYGIIDNYFQFPGTDGYMNGDFNYDGVIDAGDYGIIDNTFQLQGAPIPMTGGVAGASGAGLSGVTAVPEPATLSVLGIAGAAMLGRRRRRRTSNNSAANA
jgi:autotransporter-associated beta strand protein